jgi:GNAT superfamily N-acetyltransferase
MDLLAAVIASLRSQGMDQWDDIYPDQAVMARDLAEGRTCIIEVAHTPVGYICLDAKPPPEYAQVRWQGRHPAIVHRLMVHPDQQGRHLARRLMAWAETEARAQGHDTLQLDAFLANPAAMRLYAALGYRRMGVVRFRKGDFALFERLITCQQAPMR